MDALTPKARMSLLAAAAGLLSACVPSCASECHDLPFDPNAPPRPNQGLELSLDRDAAASATRILVTIRATDGAAGLGVQLEASGGTVVGSVQDVGGGTYTTAVDPQNPSGEIPLVATVPGTERYARKVALVLPYVAPDWGQPEAVDGYVNSFGYEDSPEVSPDGQWLSVGSDSPVSYGCCSGGCGQGAFNPRSSGCNTSVGPYKAPMRPDLFGAERILCPTRIVHSIPRMGLVMPDGSDWLQAQPPMSSVFFHRQPDGSFAEPFTMGFDSDGYLYTTFGWDFVGAPDPAGAELVFAAPDPSQAESTGTDLWWARAPLGARQVLGRFDSSRSTGVRFQPLGAVRLPLPSLAGQQGNPNVGLGGVFWDDETVPEAARDIWFNPVQGPLPDGPFGPRVRAGFSEAGVAETMAHVDGPYVYFMRLDIAAGQESIARRQLAGTDVAAPAAWGPLEELLRGEYGPVLEARIGTILAVGEPSVAHPSGQPDELYFVYIRRSNDASAPGDWNVGRVRRR